MIEHVVFRYQLLSVCCPDLIFDFRRFQVVKRDDLT